MNRNKGKCVICGQETSHFDVDFETYVHGGKCLEILFNQYIRAVMKAKRGDINESY